ncbi:TPA: helix-turn-helix domain-containing protein [Streptococcus suis]|uniref:helix-turn-helix domain-containing protein n=1 Tax=Streptococcus TaxID=1301 RepID=UPI00196083C6|nr:MULTISPECIES: helix-turn-helix transcriptional regulator [Streptococcus]MBM7192449.1 helix-turn-helix domain-containing protein [Streptococcus suis]MBY0720493.1 helix-turn-helix domain-containing protein [Streptococcus sp. 2018110]MCO8184444.1 helix-turn-helix domain-containing protein [Streptococcus suis]MCO8215991.1 helix-turn-helix domain-containing protein [Streptococcus suis]MCO8224408.1 helix-turn-helix domain-containing protein [Streptococcus suis]
MFSERLKQLRKEAGLTQKNIADNFNTSPQSYAQWEKGLRSPSKESLEKLADFFNVSTDYLLGNSDIRNPEEEIDLDDFEMLYRNTSKGMSTEEKSQLEADLKNFLLERKRLIEERELANRDK